MKGVCGGAVENALGHLKTGHHQPFSATDLQDAWRIPRTEQAGGLQSMASQRVGQD